MSHRSSSEGTDQNPCDPSGFSAAGPEASRPAEATSPAGYCEEGEQSDSERSRRERSDYNTLIRTGSHESLLFSVMALKNAVIIV